MSQNNKTQIELINKMILSGQAMDAFDRYYADDVIMQENDQPPTVGKSANRDRELTFFSSVTDFRGAQVLSVGEAGDKTYVEWFYDYTHKDWGVRRYHQMAVQTWKNGKIVHERFYYGA
jgi:hypothetical protein